MVEFQQYTPVDAEAEAWGVIAGGGMPKFDRFALASPVVPGQYDDLPVGTFYEGDVLENAKSSQAIDYDTKEPKFYKNGGPILEVHIILGVPPENEEDDGRRILRLGQHGKAALQEEMKRLGIKSFGVGTHLKMTFSGYKPNPSGRASKLYTIELTNVQPFVKQAVAQQQAGVEAALAAGYTEVAPGTTATVQQFPPATPAAVPQQVAVVPPAQVAAATQSVPVQQDVPGPIAAVQSAVEQPGLEQVQMVRQLVGVGLPRQNALEAVRDKFGGDAAWRDLLDLLEQNAPI
jgi:hypothetical protein